MSEEQTKKNIEMFFTIYGCREREVQPLSPKLVYSEVLEFNNIGDVINQILNEYMEVDEIYIGNPRDNCLIYVREKKNNL